MDPITRKEKFLAKAGGQSVKTPEPITREEMFLQRIAENGGGSGGGGGSASIDVTASVGQTIVVEEVDANGKPTKWKAAEYQPRTHWSEVVNGDLVPHMAFTPVLNEQFQMLLYPLPAFDFEAGKNYTVVYDGVEYAGTAMAGSFNGIPFVSVGNTYLHGVQSAEPFIVASIPALNLLAVVCFTEEEHTVQVIGEKTVHHKIPIEYLNYVCYIHPSLSGDSDHCEFSANWEELREAVKSGRQVVAEYLAAGGDTDFSRRTYRLEYANFGFYESEDGLTDDLYFAATEPYGWVSHISVYRYADGTVEARVSR